MANKRLTYSGPYLVPHFMQMMWRCALEATACISGALVALFDGFLFDFGAFDLSARGQSLIAQHPQGFDFRALATALAVFQDLEVTRTGFAVFVDLFDFVKKLALEEKWKSLRKFGRNSYS